MNGTELDRVSTVRANRYVLREFEPLKLPRRRAFSQVGYIRGIATPRALFSKNRHGHFYPNEAVEK